MEDKSSDIYSHAQPELACVTDICLKLKVDFEQKILKGKAILTIEKKQPTADKVVVDSKDLDIIEVSDPATGSPLEYKIGAKHCLGRAISIFLPKCNPSGDMSSDLKSDPSSDQSSCKIEIEYKTSKDSIALVWLTREQTADNKHPFLLSNIKYINARAMFPCQDTPTVKFTYSAEISVPNDFTVIMSACVKGDPVTDHQNQTVYKFDQKNRIPAYGVFIAVGSLQRIKPQTRLCLNVFAEPNYSPDNLQKFERVEKILGIAEDIFITSLQLSSWGEYNVIVLPPSVSPKSFKIAYPNVILVSPTIINGDDSLMTPLAQQISHMWTEYYVACKNYSHLWLNKSFGMFIYRRILKMLSNNKQFMINEEIEQFFALKMNRNLGRRIEKYKYSNKLLSLIPTLKNMEPNGIIECVPYEVGCILLEEVENNLGQSDFKLFLTDYFKNFQNKSITTLSWKKYLYNYFPEKKEVLGSIEWDTYFFDANLYVPYKLEPDLIKKCSTLVDNWKSSYLDEDVPHKLSELQSFSDIQKIEFLKFLYESDYFSNSYKLIQMLDLSEKYFKHVPEIRFYWILLCIKHRKKDIATTAVKYAIQFCTPKYAYPIFREVYKWLEKRLIAFEVYIRDKKNMLPETQKELDIILKLN